MPAPQLPAMGDAGHHKKEALILPDFVVPAPPCKSRLSIISKLHQANAMASTRGYAYKQAPLKALGPAPGAQWLPHNPAAIWQGGSPGLRAPRTHLQQRSPSGAPLVPGALAVRQRRPARLPGSPTPP